MIWREGAYPPPALHCSVCFVKYLLEAVAVLDEIFTQVGFVARFGGGIVKHDNHVRFKRQRALITARPGVGKDIADTALAFSGPIVVGVVLG